jgi:hypothetical protein
MKFPKQNRPRRSVRSRLELWSADMTLRRGWFRVLLHLRGMARRPRNIAWHWRFIRDAIHDRKSRN